MGLFQGSRGDRPISGTEKPGDKKRKEGRRELILQRGFVSLRKKRNGRNLPLCTSETEGTPKRIGESGGGGASPTAVMKKNFICLGSPPPVNLEDDES